MPTANEAFVTPSVLEWARKRANLTIERLAKALQVKPEVVAAWEASIAQAHPSFRQAERLAKRLHIPFAYLFLPAPPDEQIPLPDFRTVGNYQLEPSSDLIDLINDILIKQTWYREFLQSEGRTELSFVDSFSFDNSPDEVASNIAETLRIDDDFRESCDTWDNFLVKLIARIQDYGILVMRSGTVAGNTHRTISPRVFRGFAISDELAPLIFVNAADFRAAQTFTVAHELGHIWLGDTGISNEDLAAPDPSARERYCDAIAAELLVPKGSFLAKWDSHGNRIGSLAKYFRVSSLVVLRRARDLGLITQDEFDALFEQERRKYRKASQEGGDFYRGLLARNGSLFTEAVISAIYEQKELYRDGARLLNVNVGTIPQIAEYLSNPDSASKAP
jgi:Zn-dependent peptidase ImmA (M78 family)/DNA-binding XRE family transcriptional regulator